MTAEFQPGKGTRSKRPVLQSVNPPGLSLQAPLFLNAFFENWLQVDRMPLIQAFMSMTAQLSSVRF
jgi:hypothetical protein